MVKKGTIATIIAVPIVALGGAGGYYAWQQHNDSQQQQERRLSKAEHALSSLRSESAKQATSNKATSVSQSSVDVATSNDTSVAVAGDESASEAASTASTTTASQYDIFSDPNASIDQVTQAAREVVNQYTQTDLSSWALSGIRYVDGGYHVQATDPNSTTSVRYQFHMTPHEATVTMDSSSNPGMAAGTINY